MLPRTSAAGTPAFAHSAGMIAWLMQLRATGRARTENSMSACSPVLWVQPAGLAGAQGLPGVDGLADDRVDGLGERGAGLVDGDVEEADGIVGEDVG